MRSDFLLVCGGSSEQFSPLRHFDHFLPYTEGAKNRQRSQAASLPLCFEIVSAEHSLHCFSYNAFHKELKHSQGFCQVLCHFIAKITFPPVSSNSCFHLETPQDSLCCSYFYWLSRSALVFFQEIDTWPPGLLLSF